MFNEGCEWSTDGTQENVWVQIRLPFEVSVWKITIAGKSNNLERWYDWKFEGSNDSNEWIILKSATGEYVDSRMKKYVLSKPSEAFVLQILWGARRTH